MRISVRGCWSRGCGEALGDEVQHGSNLLACHVKLLHDFLDAQILKIFNDCRHGQPRMPKHPCAADLVEIAFHGVTLRPIKRCHRLLPPYIVISIASCYDVSRSALCPMLGSLKPRKPQENPRMNCLTSHVQGV